jgi:hypothetical protein
VESLELRRFLATITVNSAGDTVDADGVVTCQLGARGGFPATRFLRSASQSL